MKTSVIWKISKDKLKKIVSKSSTFAEILRSFDVKISTGGNYRTLYKRLDTEGIDYSHITKGLNANKGKSISPRFSLKEILVKDSKYASPSRLKIRVIREGLLKEVCLICGIDPKWNGEKLTLIFDHINGVNNDNRIENLRLVCPNCESQLPTHSGKNKFRYRKKNKCGGHPAG